MKIINLNKSYKDGKSKKQILKNVNISFNNTGLVFITGRSGSGKTTLLNIIAGFDKADSGEIINNDIDILKLSDSQLSNYRKYNVGFIAQDYHLINDFTVLENILLGDNTMDIESDEFKSVINQLGLQDHLKKKSIDLSGGEKQRVAIARVLLKGSKIILADEPTGNLDDDNSEIVFNYLKNISKDHLVIVVTHDINSAKKYADRIIELKSGEISNDSKKNSKDDNIEFKFEGKEKFTNKRIFKYSTLFLFLKKIFLFLCLLICSASFGEVYTLLTFQRTSQTELAYKVIENDDSTNFVINKRYVKRANSGDAYSYNYNIPVSDNEIKELDNRFSLEDYDTIKTLTFNFARDNYNYAFMFNQISRTKVFNNDNFLKKYNWEIEFGHIPSASNEFLLTDYALYSMWQLNPEGIDNILGVEYSSLKTDDSFKDALSSLEEKKKELLFGLNYEEAINDNEIIKKLRNNPGLLIIGDWFVFNSFVSNSEKQDSSIWPMLVGSISTNCLEKYGDLLFTSQNDFDHTNTRMLELSELTDHSLFSFYSRTGFDDYFYKYSWYDTNADAFVFNADRFNLYGYDLQLNNDELVMSDKLYKRVFQSQFNQFDNVKHKIEWVANNDSMVKENILFSKEYKVKETISLSGPIKDVMGDIDFIIINNSEYSKFIETIKSNFNWGICINKKEFNKIDINTDFFINRKFTLYSLTASSIYIAFNGAEVQTDLMLTFSMITLSIGYLLVALFFVLLVSKRKRDVGIMKALGYSNKQFNYLFGFCGLMFAGMIMLSSIILSIFLFSIFNVRFQSNILRIGLLVDNNLVLLKPNYPIFFIIMGITFAIIVLIVVVANIINKKITPISAIKSL